MREPGGPVARELSRRDFLGRVGALGAGAIALSALPIAERMIAADPALAAVSFDDATLQAFADTIIPGRRVERTDLGDEIHPQAIAGVDPEPGAVEADALRLYKNPLVGFAPALVGPFLTDLSLRSLPHGGPFLNLGFDQRVAVCVQALDFGNGDRALYEAAAAVPFTAFCAAAEHPVGTDEVACGYRVMGYPGAAPAGYRSFTYRRKLANERTKRGSLG
jgi:hypothetical protein